MSMKFSHWSIVLSRKNLACNGIFRELAGGKVNTIPVITLWELKLILSRRGDEG